MLSFFIVWLVFLYLKGAIWGYDSSNEFLIILSMLTVMIVVWSLVIERVLNPPSNLNIILFLVLCIGYFFVKSELTRNDVINSSRNFRFVLALYDVFLVFMGTVLMNMFFKRERLNEFKNEEKTADQHEK